MHASYLWFIFSIQWGIDLSQCSIAVATVIYIDLSVETDWSILVWINVNWILSTGKWKHLFPDCALELFVWPYYIINIHFSFELFVCFDFCFPYFYLTCDILWQYINGRSNYTYKHLDLRNKQILCLHTVSNSNTICVS